MALEMFNFSLILYEKSFDIELGTIFPSMAHGICMKVLNEKW